MNQAPSSRVVWSRLLPCLALVGCVIAIPAQAIDSIFRDGFEPVRAISPDPGFTGSDSHLVVGPGGVVHMVYAGVTDADDQHGPVRYGECAGNCMEAANWHFITLGEYGSSALGGGPRIDLTANGQPRAWWYGQSQVSGTGTFYYAVCHAGCTSLAGWTVAPVLGIASALVAIPSHEPFALDSQDHPYFFYQNLIGNTELMLCSSGCTSAANWSDIAFATGFTAAVDLLFDGLTPYFLDDYVTLDPGSLLAFGGYGPSGWASYAIFQPTTDTLATVPFSLALDGAKPRVALYWIDDAGTPEHRLVYGACDTNCDGSGFSWVDLGLPSSSGFAGLSLQLDDHDHPHIAYSGDADATGLNSQRVSLITCTGNCAQAGTTWSVPIVIEARGAIGWPVPPAEPPCTADNQWYVGAEPSLALHGGTSHLSWDISYLGACPDGLGGYTVVNVSGPIRYAER